MIKNLKEGNNVWTRDPYGFLSELEVFSIHNDGTALCGDKTCGIPQMDDSLEDYYIESLFNTLEEAKNYFKYFKLYDAESGKIIEIGNHKDKLSQKNIIK